MMPRRVLAALLFSQSLLVPQPLHAEPAAPMPGERPNVVVILADDVGWGDLGCYGATRIQTPHLDGLAKGGLRFTNSYAPAAVCTPTRYSMLTGRYPFRHKDKGVAKGVANGDSPLLIPPGMATLPGVLKAAGYRTGIVGKWHLGFTTGKPDYNEELKPGPLEVGFDEFFGLPATNDRMPPVLIRNHRVLNLDPADPIRCSYDEAEAKRLGMTRMAGGRQRIGWMSGGKSAVWQDTALADTFTGEAVAFIERHRAQSFFLCFTPHDCHAPVIPHPRFAGTSGLSARADMIHELDASVGQVLAALDRCGVSGRTLVVFSSDNGAYVIKEKNHRPNGPYRGEKSQLWEGGSRVPMIARWPGRVAPGVSDALAGLIDLPATVAAAAGVKPAAGAMPDSTDLLPVLTGQAGAKGREELVLMSGTGVLALRKGPWKFIPNLALANGWKAGKTPPAERLKGPGLFDLGEDPGETRNRAAEHPTIVKQLAARLARIRGEAGPKVRAGS